MRRSRRAVLSRIWKHESIQDVFYDVNFERFSTIGQLYSFIRVEVAGVLFLLPPFLITFISNGTPDVFIWFLFVFAFFLNVLGSLLRTA